jgi:hypothetical protein
LLRRRAYALCRIVTDGLEFPFIEDAARDLRAILAFEPNNLRPALDLTQELFTHGGFEDADTAEIAEELAMRAQAMMLEARALQVRALVYADRPDEAQAVASSWRRLFPDHEGLVAAAKEIPF